METMAGWGYNQCAPSPWAPHTLNPSCLAHSPPSAETSTPPPSLALAPVLARLASQDNNHRATHGQECCYGNRSVESGAMVTPLGGALFTASHGYGGIGDTVESCYSQQHDFIASQGHHHLSHHPHHHGHHHHLGDFHHHQQHESQQQHHHGGTIARRNERERTRVKTINSTFSRLRQHLPCSAKSRKLSKVQILKSAIQYIGQLQKILDTQEAKETNNNPDMKLNRLRKAEHSQGDNVAEAQGYLPRNLLTSDPSGGRHQCRHSNGSVEHCPVSCASGSPASVLSIASEVTQSDSVGGDPDSLPASVDGEADSMPDSARVLAQIMEWANH